MTERRRPAAFRLDDPEVRVGDVGALPALDGRVVVTPEAVPEEAVEALAPPLLPKRRRGPWGALFWSALGGLVTLGVSLSLARLIEDLYSRSPTLGWVGLALAVLFAIALVVIIGRELAALMRLSRVEHFRERAAAVLLSDDREKGRAVAADLRALYAGRPDLAAARATLDADLSGIVDGADRIRLAERALLEGLDARALRLVMTSAKRVSLVTAVAPRAVFDVLMVAIESTRLIRRIADLYGARPGALGMLRLGRAVLGHLVVTGGLAAGEGIVEQFVGHGLAARLSAKLGEGVVNGMMTARVGLATIELIRPLPFAALPRPKLGSVIAELTRGG